MDINEYRRRGECSQPSRRARNHRRGKGTDDHEGRGFLRGKHQREWLACPHAILTVGGVDLCKNNINQMVTIATYKNERVHNLRHYYQHTTLNGDSCQSGLQSHKTIVASSPDNDRHVVVSIQTRPSCSCVFILVISPQ